MEKLVTDFTCLYGLLTLGKFSQWFSDYETLTKLISRIRLAFPSIYKFQHGCYSVVVVSQFPFLQHSPNAVFCSFKIMFFSHHQKVERSPKISPHWCLRFT